MNRTPREVEGLQTRETHEQVCGVVFDAIRRIVPRKRSYSPGACNPHFIYTCPVCGKYFAARENGGRHLWYEHKKYRRVVLGEHPHSHRGKYRAKIESGVIRIPLRRMVEGVPTREKLIALVHHLNRTRRLQESSG